MWENPSRKCTRFVKLTIFDFVRMSGLTRISDQLKIFN
jgi:hypothetical protein